MSHLRSCVLLAAKIASLLTVLLTPTPALGFFSEILGYLKGYQVGVDYTTSFDSVGASYEMARPAAGPTNTCLTKTNQADRQICSVTMRGGSSSGYGLVLQQAFKRQGLFYFRPDISFGVRYLNGSLDKHTIAEDEGYGLPLTNLKFSLGAVVVKPYIQFGITPASTWPDLLISLGPVAQAALGKVTINQTTQNAAVLSSSGSLITGFVELELVFLRFGNGALSLFTESDLSGGGRGSKLVPKSVDGMDDFHATFGHSVGGSAFGFGVKILSNWP